MKTITMLNMLSAAIGGHLHELEEISLKDDAGKSDCCYPSYGSSAPSLYISGRKDSKVYDMPKEGTAKIKFRMRSKGVDYRENGEETYRTDIEVQSIEPVNLEAIVNGYEFGSAGQASMRRTMKSLLKKGDVEGVNRLKKRVLRQGDGALDRAAGKRYPQERIPAIIKGKNAEGRAWDKINKSYDLDAILAKHDFTDRARDTGGRFAPGMNVSAEDMDAAYGQKKKKRTAVLAGVGAAGLATAAVAGGRSGGLSQAAGRLLRG